MLHFLLCNQGKRPESSCRLTNVAVACWLKVTPRSATNLWGEPSSLGFPGWGKGRRQQPGPGEGEQSLPAAEALWTEQTAAAGPERGLIIEINLASVNKGCAEGIS